MASFAVNGTRTSGQEVRDDNTTAVQTISNIVRNSLGPAGLDKMIVDDVGELNITNDGATILGLIEVEHPAAKILVELAGLQDKEIGDGTTSVVLMAAELVRRGNELIKNSIHPTTVIAGFQQAKRQAIKFIAENLSYRTAQLGEKCLLNAARTAMSSKVIGQAHDHFAALAVDAMKSIAKVDNSKSRSSKLVYNIKDISILKIRGGSLSSSRLVGGVAILRNRTLSSYGMPSSLKNAKIAFLSFDLRKERLKTNVKVVCDNPENLEAIRDEETAIIERRVNLLLDSGANAIFCSQPVDEFVLHMVAKRGGVAAKSVAPSELRRLAKLTGGRVLTSLAALDSKDCAEKADVDAFGKADEIFEERVGDVAHLLVVKAGGAKGTAGAQTIILRGPNEYALDETERSLHDVLCALKRVLESSRVVVGGGVVESALSVYLENFAQTIGSREQLAIAEFAAALLVIPRTLAANGAFDAIELMASLRAAHNAVVVHGKSEYKNVGLNLQKGNCGDNLKKGVLEPAMSKIKSIKFATEAAITILRIDDSVVMNPKPAPRPGGR